MLLRSVTSAGRTFTQPTNRFSLKTISSIKVIEWILQRLLSRGWHLFCSRPSKAMADRGHFSSTTAARFYLSFSNAYCNYQKRKKIISSTNLKGGSRRSGCSPPASPHHFPLLRDDRTFIIHAPYIIIVTKLTSVSWSS